MKLTPFPTIPLPNWNLTYNGLSNIPAIGSVFKTVSITHGYKSNYAINSWATNVYYVLVLSYIATFGSNVLSLGLMFASVMVTASESAPLTTVWRRALYASRVYAPEKIAVFACAA